LTVESAVHATGDMLLESAAGQLVIGANVSTGGGDISLLGTAVTHNTGTTVSSAGGTIDEQASAGDLVVVDGATVESAGGQIRLSAANDARISGIAAASKVSVVAGGDLLDDGAGVAIQADAARLEA